MAIGECPASPKEKQIHRIKVASFKANVFKDELLQQLCRKDNKTINNGAETDKCDFNSRVSLFALVCPCLCFFCRCLCWFVPVCVCLSLFVLYVPVCVF